MRSAFSTILVCLTAIVCHAQGLVINEVMPGGGAQPDWIELRNSGRRAVDVKGYSLSAQEAHHRLIVSRTIPPGGVVVLYCDDASSGSDTLIPFRLPRKGGGLLLVAPDQRTIADLFTWPSLPAGYSVGRAPTDPHGWRILDHPTPGAPNPATAGYSRILEPPAMVLSGTNVSVPHEHGVQIHYTLDGTTPTEGSPVLDQEMEMTCHAVFTARAFAKDALASRPVSHTRLCDAGGTALSLRIDPADLHESERGLFAIGDNANYSRRGPAWQRMAELEWHTDTATTAIPVRVGISGSGTRGLAKKSLKVTDEITGAESILRADASPDAFLRNLFMEHVANLGSHVDVQRSTPVPLFINGAYHGLYRAMPAKNTDWLRGLCDAEEIDLIGGPEAEVIHGGKARYRAAMDQLLGDAPLDTLMRVIDMRSLMDLACFDLWTGRADQDLNVRCWRPRMKGARWRWILYDMDLWSMPKDPTVQRLLSAPTPESPYLAALLSAPDRRAALLARTSAWLATALAPDRAAALARKLFDEHGTAMANDHRRWMGKMNMNTPEASFAGSMDHIALRAGVLIDQLERTTGQRTQRVQVEVLPHGAGRVYAEELYLTDGARKLTVFDDAPVLLRAEATEGFRFVGWQGSGTTSTTMLAAGSGKRTLRAVFKVVAPSGKDALEQ